MSPELIQPTRGPGVIARGRSLSVHSWQSLAASSSSTLRSDDTDAIEVAEASVDQTEARSALAVRPAV